MSILFKLWDVFNLSRNGSKIISSTTFKWQKKAMVLINKGGGDHFFNSYAKDETEIEFDMKIPFSGFEAL